MLFPVSGVEVNPVWPFVVAFVVSFFTSMGGVSGAFLLLPFQVRFLGCTSPSVSATNQGFNIVAIPSGVYRVNEAMLDALRRPGVRQHASNLGAVLAHEIAGQAGAPAFIVDPVSVDEF